MKILFIGTFKKEYSTHHPIVRELKNKNHKVIKFDFRLIPFNYMWIKSNFYSMRLRRNFNTFINLRLYIPDLIRNLRYYIFGNWRTNKFLFNIVKINKFDLIFLAKAENINYKLVPKLNNYSKTYYYFMDPLRVSYEMNAHKLAKLSTISSASTTAMYNLFRKSGANSYYVLEGYDEKIFKRGDKKELKDIDVVFAGVNLLDRYKYINYLRQNGINVICYGYRWENKPVHLDKLVEIYRKSKIVLNFPRVDTGFSDRVFQVMGTGSFMLSKYCSDLPKVFKKGIHLDWFNSPEECLELVNLYLKNDIIREKISLEGYQFVLNNYTWKKRVEKILQIVEAN